MDKFILGRMVEKESRGIDPLERNPTLVFKTSCRPFSGTLHLGCLTRLELANTGFTDQRRDRFSFRHKGIVGLEPTTNRLRGDRSAN
jgi:hypothetical protein